MVNLRNFNAVSPAALQQLANNPSIARNLRDVFPHPYTIADARFFLELVEHNKVGHVFAIYDRETFVGVGSIVPQADVYRHSAEIGYWLGEPFWNKGYATETVKLLTQYAFEQLNLVRVYAGVFAGNIASMKVLEKAGYQLEAVLQSSVTKYGKLLDQHLYSILAPQNAVKFS
jgi:ribosomal-protein-alanine N-acetyltransferase